MNQNNDDDDLLPLTDDDSQEALPKIVSPLDIPPLWVSSFAVQLFLLLCVIATALHLATIPDARFWMATKTSVFRDHKVYQLITAVLTHADYLHLLSNAPMIFIFGYWSKHYYGALAFPVGALFVAVFTHAATLYFYEPETALIGASGMAYGMVAIWMVYYLAFATQYRIGKRILRVTGVSLILMFPSSFDRHVSYLAHAFGFAFGLIYATATIGLARKALFSAFQPPK